MKNFQRLAGVLSLGICALAYGGTPQERTLRPGYLGLAVAVPAADADALDRAGRADVTALCPAVGTDPARQEPVTPLRGVPLGTVSRSGGAAVAELLFPYSYDALYTALLLKRCAAARLAPSATGTPPYRTAGDVPIMTEWVTAPEKHGPAPIAPREAHAAMSFRVAESQLRFLEPGDRVDTYFVCPRWPEYMRKPGEEWVSIKPANAIRVLDLSRTPGQESATLEIWKPSAKDLGQMARDCTLFLARRAPGDQSSAGMTGVTLTSYGFDQRWEHWGRRAKE
ncbi:MAG: hypothetical protein NTY77_10140 [Elusimicrobia bacterium]|nr:hypothetical protein [Elusimicrobiota bacterium]